MDYIGSDISGTKYDVAHVKWGGSWRMPTLSEINELVNNCSWIWTTYNGVQGQMVTGPNGNKIFLPVAVYRWNSVLLDAGNDGYCWSSTISGYNENRVYYLHFYSKHAGWNYYYRCIGRSVRPVQ